MLINQHVQTTATVWPNNQPLKEQLSMPLALSLHPFIHEQLQGSITPQDINSYRCQSCKAFINQLCFIRGDKEYDCSICGCTNQLANQIDISMPQLNNLSYKLRAPKNQRLLTTDLRCIAFILDLSDYGDQSKKYLLYALHVIRQFIKTVASNNTNFNIMILGFDDGLHRFYLNKSNKKIQRIITSNEQEAEQHYFPDLKRMMFDSTNQQKQLMQILNLIEANTINNRLREASSNAILQALKLAFIATQGYSGKIFLVSGLRQQLKQFNDKLKLYSFDVMLRHSFTTNKKQCISPQLQKLLSSTQMSLGMFFINNHFINNMPFHCMTKQLNGQLRHYFPNQLLQFFHDFRDNVEILLSDNTAYQSLMRVRYSTGLRMVGIFGTFRQTKVPDQVELITCPYNRKYMYQFIVQGRINSDFVVIQFSSLYTDFRGERFFIIETHVNRVSDQLASIVPSIEYANINISYVRGIVHNLDSASKLRNLQLILQQRCKKHIKTVLTLTNNEQNEDIMNCELLRKAKPYVIITFLMMKHFLLNQIYGVTLNFDLNAQIRSKIATLQQSINIIWPIAYAINEQTWEIIEMSEKYLSKAKVAIFIDRCDQNYVYLSDLALQSQLNTANGKEILYQMIENQPSLNVLRSFIQETKLRKGLKYLDMKPLQEISQLKILDIGGQFGFDKFINQILRG